MIRPRPHTRRRSSSLSAIHNNNGSTDHLCGTPLDSDCSERGKRKRIRTRSTQMPSECQLVPQIAFSNPFSVPARCPPLLNPTFTFPSISPGLASQNETKKFEATSSAFALSGPSLAVANITPTGGERMPRAPSPTPWGLGAIGRTRSASSIPARQRLARNHSDRMEDDIDDYEGEMPHLSSSVDTDFSFELDSPRGSASPTLRVPHSSPEAQDNDDVERLHKHAFDDLRSETARKEECWIAKLRNLEGEGRLLGRQPCPGAPTTTRVNSFASDVEIDMVLEELPSSQEDQSLKKKREIEDLSAKLGTGWGIQDYARVRDYQRSCGVKC